MNVSKLGVALILAGSVLASGAIAADEGAARPIPDGDGVLTAADFVQAALQAEGGGDATQRAQYLKEALADDPEYAPARWHSGFLRQQDRWLTIPASQEEFRSDPRLDAYATFRASLPETPERELLLARWCQNQRLSEQAEFHWMNVLQLAPNHDEALNALDVTWYQGRLVKRDALAQQKRADYQAARNSINANPTLKRRCEATIARWERLADNDDPSLHATMEADVAAEKYPGAVPLFNGLLCERFRSPRNPRELEQVSVEWMKVLAQDDKYIKLLVEHSIWSPQEAVRHAAADHLKSKRFESFVPLYLLSARFPVEFACSTMANSGLSSMRLNLNVEGLDSDIQIEHVASYEQIVPLDESLLPVPEPGVTNIYFGGDVVAKQNLAKNSAWRASAQQVAYDIQARVNRYNAISAAINERVTTALARATGGQSESNPRAWQDWWATYLTDYYELEGADEDSSLADDSDLRQADPSQNFSPSAGPTQNRPVRNFSSASDQQEVIQPVQPVASSNSKSGPANMQFVGRGFGSARGTTIPWRKRYWRKLISCFAGPTLVWTNTGLRPIQDIQPGDQVLSQNAATGEVAYKTVELVTKRAPSPMIRVQVGSEEILATRGHPFWVIGKRWTMAKHLQAGDMLHTVTGPIAITHVEPTPAPEAWYDVAYNLQVRDFHTYFVGQQQLLVHHLSMLSILDEGSTIVPGL
jgi:hypothetical protein